jgi:isoleucyl-tRNA synthetase
MEMAQTSCSLVLALRKKENLRVRQPLQKIMIPAMDKKFSDNLQHIKDLILSEVNVKELELISDDNDILVKSIKANFKTIGPKYGKQMKAIAAIVGQLKAEDIATIEKNKGWKGQIEGVEVELDMNDFEIQAQDIPGWLVASEGNMTVALDITLNEQLIAEGIARELVNRVQNLRKEVGLEVTDRIVLKVETNEANQKAIRENQTYICAEVLATDIFFETLSTGALITDLADVEDTKLVVEKIE